MKNIPRKGRRQGQVTVLEFYTLWNTYATAKARDLQILYTGRPCEVSLVMSECSLSGHVSNF